MPKEVTLYLLTQTFHDNKQWARDILKKVEQGIQVRPICLTFAKEALRIKDDI